MPELPEVEVLARYLDRVLPGRTVRRLMVHRPRVCRPTSVSAMETALTGTRFLKVTRRGKYLLFTLQRRKSGEVRLLLGHLGMAGRLYLLPPKAASPKHASVEMELDRGRLVLEDPRYFGRVTLDVAPLRRLGPEPLEAEFGVARLAEALGRSRKPVKVRLLDQSALAGVGNIYASEALFRARVSPQRPADQLSVAEVVRLRQALRAVLRAAIAWGSTVPLHWRGRSRRRGQLFYYGLAPGVPDVYEERLRVYDREGEPCPRCAQPICRIEQAGRSTYYCPACQR